MNVTSGDTLDSNFSEKEFVLQIYAFQPEKAVPILLPPGNQALVLWYEKRGKIIELFKDDANQAKLIGRIAIFVAVGVAVLVVIFRVYCIFTGKHFYSRFTAYATV